MDEKENLKYVMLAVNKAVDIITKFLSYKNLVILGITNEDILKLAKEAVDSGIIEDMIAYAEKDPAAKNNYSYVYESCKGFEAMIYYRIAHILLESKILPSNEAAKVFLWTLARKITEEAKVRTGIDINPSCKIGKGCVIDHGVGTKIGQDYANYTNVVGETTEIGDNCIILNDVVLGASEVNKGQISRRRHPKIGNNVTICSGSRILGGIKIGNNVFIGTGVIVTHDIPSDCQVTLHSQYQVIKKEGKQCIDIHGLIQGDIKDTFIIGGENLTGITLFLIVNDEIYREVEGPLSILNNTGKKVIFKAPKYKKEKAQKVMLRVTIENDTEFYIYSELLNKSVS